MRPKTILFVSVLALTLFSVGVSSQAPPAAPKPGPEVKKLGAFVGKWTSSGEMPKDVMGPGTGGKFTGTETCEWVAGGFAVLCRDSDQGAGMPNSSGVGVLTYDPEAKNYVYFGAGSDGTSFVSHGTVTGDTWSWTSKSTMNGQPMEMHYTVKWNSKDACDYKLEGGPDANSMKTMMEGKQTRATAKPAGTKPSSD